MKAASVWKCSNLRLKPISVGLSFPKFQMETMIPDPPTSQGDYQNNTMRQSHTDTAGFAGLHWVTPSSSTASCDN